MCRNKQVTSMVKDVERRSLQKQFFNINFYGDGRHLSLQFEVLVFFTVTKVKTSQRFQLLKINPGDVPRTGTNISELIFGRLFTPPRDLINPHSRTCVFSSSIGGRVSLSSPLYPHHPAMYLPNCQSQQFMQFLNWIAVKYAVWFLVNSARTCLCTFLLLGER